MPLKRMLSAAVVASSHLRSKTTINRREDCRNFWVSRFYPRQLGRYAVRHDAGGQRVVWIEQPAGQVEPITRLSPDVQSGQDVRCVWLNLLPRLQEITANQHMSCSTAISFAENAISPGNSSLSGQLQVPEPASLVLVLGGAILLAAASRRRP